MITFLNKHKVQYATFTMDMITDTFIALKCNIEITNQDEYNEYFRSIHGIIAAHLKRQHSIKVDSKVVFKLDPALNIENVGPDEQNNILHGWYTRSVGRAVLTKNSNKANADLNEDRSTEFLREVEASTSKTFFPKFKINQDMHSQQNGHK